MGNRDTYLSHFEGNPPYDIWDWLEFNHLTHMIDSLWYRKKGDTKANPK